jgi:hypothetical protein
MQNDLDAATLSLEQHLSTFVDLTKLVPITTKEIKDFNAALGQGPEQDPAIIGNVIAGLKSETDRLAPTIGNALRDGIGSGLTGLGDVILGAIQGGGDVAASVGAKIFGDVGAKLGEHLGKAIGGTLGSTIGSFFGPIGTLIGGWIGGVVDDIGHFFGRVFGGKSEVSKARDAWFGQWEDGFIGVQRALVGTIGEVGQQDWVKMLFDAKTVEEFNRVVAMIEAELAKIGRNIEPVVIPVTYGHPGEAPDAGNPPEMARGGVILPFVPRAAQGLITPKRPGGQLVMAHSGEVVAPVKALFAEVGKAAAAAAGGGTIHVHLHLDGREIADVVVKRNKAGLAPMRVG